MDGRSAGSCIDPKTTRIILIKGGPRLLPAFSPGLSVSAARALERLGVELCLGAPVTHCDADGVVLGNERVDGRTLIWAAGVAASPAADWLSAQRDRSGRVMVGPDLTVPRHPEIFVWLGLYNADGEWPWTYFFLLVIQLIFAIHRFGRSLGLDAITPVHSHIRSGPGRILLAAAT